MEDISCQQFSTQAQYYNPHVSGEYYYEGNDISEQPEQYDDDVNYMENDDFEDAPMVRSVPSHDIQELYMRKPMLSASHSSASQPARYYFNHFSVPEEYDYTIKPSPPQRYNFVRPHTGIQSVPRRSNSDYTTPSNAFAPCIRKQENVHPKTDINHQESPAIRSAPTLPVSAGGTPSPNERLKFIDRRSDQKRPVIYRNVRPLRRPITATPRKHPVFTESHPFQNNLSAHKRLTKPQTVSTISKSQEIKPPSETPSNTFKSKSHLDVNNCYEDVGVKKMNSEGDAPHVEAELTEMDNIAKIVATLDADEADHMSDEQRKEIRKMAKFLAPRVPSSVKAQQERAREKQEERREPNDSNSPLNGMINEQMKTSHTSIKQSLDNILDQLDSCETSLNAVRSRYGKRRAGNSKSAEGTLSQDKALSSGIFNLREISERMSKVSSEKVLEDTHSTENNSEQSRASSNSASREDIEEKCSSVGSSNSKEHLNDSALELHRSKSYIVDLIDRALSKELGTHPKERNMKNEFLDLSAARALNRIASTCRKNQEQEALKKLNASQEVDCYSSTTDSKQSLLSMDHVREPAYIKQLKELRWGHFKHIQQEVKRLEDLERFLDICCSQYNSSS